MALHETARETGEAEVIVPDAALQGRVAVVTGASRGIGREIVLALAGAGCDVVIAAKSVTEKPNLPGTIHSVAAEARALGARALAVQVDVRDDSAVRAMVARTVAEFGRLDILICNSGACGGAMSRILPFPSSTLYTA